MTKKDTTPMKGAGTQFFRLKDDKESTAIQDGTISATEIKNAENWDRIAKIKELSPGEVTAESYEDNYLDDPNAEWKSTSQGAKSAGETMTRTIKLTNVGKPLLAETNRAGD